MEGGGVWREEGGWRLAERWRGRSEPRQGRLWLAAGRSTGGAVSGGARFPRRLDLGRGHAVAWVARDGPNPRPLRKGAVVDRERPRAEDQSAVVAAVGRRHVAVHQRCQRAGGLVGVGGGVRPAPDTGAALAFEAAVDADFEVFLHAATAGFDPRGPTAHRAAQSGGNLLPVINAVAVAQQVTKQGAKLMGVLAAQRAGAQGLQCRLTVGVVNRLHQAAKLGVVADSEGAHGLGDVPAVQQPKVVGEVLLTQRFQPFVPVAQDSAQRGGIVRVALELEAGRPKTAGGCVVASTSSDTSRTLVEPRV